MATISERLAYILTFDTTQGVKSLQAVGSTAEKELGKADAKLDKLGAGMVKFGAGAMAFAGIAGAGLFKMASGAADAEANMSALEQVVGETVAHQIGKWAEGSAKGVGMASKDAVAAATSFAQLGKIINLGGEDLSKFSTDLVGLSADFAAFKNVAPEQALMDVQAAFAGSTEVMRKYGIFLDDATLKTAYFRETGEKVTGTLSAQQKIVAINAEMYRQGADMLGQWGRESGELQGQLATMKANLTNLSDEIGAGVLPHLMTLISLSSKLVGGLASADSATNGLIGTVATFGVGALALAGSISFVVGKLILMRDQISGLATRFPRTMSTMTAAAVPLGVAMVGLGMYARDAATDAAKLSAAIGELGRTADAEILDAFNRALLQSVAEGNGVNNMLTELARTNLGAAQRIVEVAKAKGEDTEITRLLEAEIAKEIAARKQAAETTELETGLLDENTGATDDNTASTEDNTEAKVAWAKALDDGMSKMDLTAAKLDHLGRRYDALKGVLSDKRAFLDIQDGFDTVERAAIEAYDAAQKGSADAESKARDYERAIIDQKLRIAEYIEGLGKIPPDKLTSVNAAIDAGDLALAEELLNQLARERFVSISPGVALGNSKKSTAGGGSKGTNIAGATGGIVNRPTVALIGEAGPEAVIPLNRAPGASPLPAGGLGVTNVTNNISMNLPAGYGPDEIIAAQRRYARIQGPL